MGYGLSFWPIPVMASIGGLIGNEFGEPNKYVWFIPVSDLPSIYHWTQLTISQRLGQSPLRSALCFGMSLETMFAFIT